MSTTSVTVPVNGINVDQLQGIVEAVTENPAAGQTRWHVASVWQGGTRTDHHIESCHLGGQEVRRPFTIRIDEPTELCGTNQYPNPQEYLMAALNACMMVGFTAVSALMGIKLTRLEIEVTGDIDMRGFLGIDPQVKPGYDALRQTVRIAGDGTPEQFQKLHEVVQATSPNFFNITQRVPVKSELIIGK